MADTTISGLNSIADNQVIGSLVVPSSVGNSTYKLTLNQISNYVIQNQGLICDVLIVAGGGGANNAICGGGGGGGVLYLENYAIASGQTINVTVGDGGRAGTVSLVALNGDNSKFNDMVAVGGGAGGQSYVGFGKNGGCGGGGSRSSAPGSLSQIGGAGIPGQGFPRGRGSNVGGADNQGSGGGGGGAGGPGYASGQVSETNAGAYAGHGGPGAVCVIDGNITAYSGGGGGGAYNGAGGYGGEGGGGGGASNGSVNGGSGTANTGGGGGGGGYSNGSQISSSGGKGGSGIVIVRYKGAQVATGGQSVTTYAINGITYTVHKYLTTGNSTFVVP